MRVVFAFVAGALVGALAGCGVTAGLMPAPVPAAPALSASQQAVLALKQEYLAKFLTPATAYALAPLCPQPPGGTCSSPQLVADLKAADDKAHDAIFNAETFADAQPQADATEPLAAARQALTAAEAALPGAT